MKKNIVAGGCRLDFGKCDHPDGQMSDPACCGTCRYCGEKRIRMGMLQMHEEECKKINPVAYGYLVKPGCRIGNASCLIKSRK